MKKLVPFLIAFTCAALTMAYAVLERANNWDTSPILAFERKLLDLKFLARGRIDVEPKVVIAAGDEKTIQSFGRWGTWDRARYARILDNLFAAGADVVAFDMVFSDAPGIDHDNAAKLATLLDAAKLSSSAGQLAIGASEGTAPPPQELARIAMSAHALEEAFATATAGDALLAKAFDEHSTRIVQGFIAEHHQDASALQVNREAALASLVDKGFAEGRWGTDWKRVDASGDARARGSEGVWLELDGPRDAKASQVPYVLDAAGDLVLPQPDFFDVASYVGFFSAVPDPDGVLRRHPLVYRAGDVFLPSLPLLAASLHVGGSYGVLVDPTLDGKGVARIGLPLEGGGLVQVPVDARGLLLVNYYGPSMPSNAGLPKQDAGVFPRVSLADIYEGTFDKKAVEGKIVLIAVTALGTFDQRVTPFSPMAPGSEVHAAAIQNILDGVALVRDFQHQVQWEMVLAVVIALILAIGLPRVPVALGVLLFGALAVGWLAFDFLVLFRDHQWFYDTPILLQLAFTWGGITVWGYLTEGREKAQLKKEFSTVLSPTVVDQLLVNPAMAGLGGAERELTVMFSDIRGFTTMSEKLSPEGLTQFLNEYLTPMTEILIKHNGTLDKYMGDAIMAFWGAPIEQADHATRACVTAVEMLEKLEELKRKWRAEGKPEIDIGIGLNSGLMRVGFMGSERMRNYTLLGDNVNLGSRLEGTNKNYGTHIIVSEATYERAKDAVHGRLLDAVRVKGKKEPVFIYEVLGKGPMPLEKFVWVEKFEAALRAYRALRFDDAARLFTEANTARKGGDPPSEVYLERCEHFRTEPPPDGWDGVYEFKTK